MSRVVKRSFKLGIAKLEQSHQRGKTVIRHLIHRPEHVSKVLSANRNSLGAATRDGILAHKGLIES